MLNRSNNSSLHSPSFSLNSDYFDEKLGASKIKEKELLNMEAVLSSDIDDGFTSDDVDEKKSTITPKKGSVDYM